MSAVRSRRAVTAGSISLALALAAPAAAFADPASQQGPPSNPGEQRSATATATIGEQGPPESPGNGTNQAPGQDHRQDNGQDDGQNGGQNDEQNTASGQGDDPAGNNGTIKIDGVAFDSGRGNEPHVGCVFQIDFYGFDTGDTADITFTGQAPTRTGVLHSESGTVISDDAAGGGQDRDATLTYSVADELSELRQVEPHPKQGWHVKVEIDVASAPGGAKQKVFWIECQDEQAPVDQTPEEGDDRSAGGGDTGDTDSGTVGAGGGDTTTEQPTTPLQGQTPDQAAESPQEPATPQNPSIPQEPVDLSGETAAPATGELPQTPTPAPAPAPAAPDAAVAPRSGEGTVVAEQVISGTTVEAATAGLAPVRSTVSARGAVGPATLPFTGGAELSVLVALGVGALGLGGIANRIGTRELNAKHVRR